MLPTIEQPLFSLEIPSTGKKIEYRPFTVAEEKILLIAKESAANDIESKISALKQLIRNCVITPIDVDKLASFDIEYIFVKLRACSVSNVIELQLNDFKGNPHKVTLNLDDVKVNNPGASNKILLSEKQQIGIKLHYPTFDDLTKISALEKADQERISNVLRFLIDSIYNEETVFPVSEYTPEELDTFISNMNLQQIAKINKWIDDLPFVYIDTTLNKGTADEEVVRVAGLSNFFSF